MYWKDEGYLLSKHNLDENSIIIETFTLDHGKYTGIVYGGSSKKQKRNFQVGNKILLNWKSKNQNRSGYFNVELIKPISPFFFDDKKRSICILSATSILKMLLPERQTNKKIYISFENMLKNLSSDNWIKLYINWELSLVKELGFETLKYNVVAAQMSRGKSERTLASTLGSLANTLSRFAMDVCLYMSQNFGFVSFPEQLTTGSSIMPHKKNPDVFELIRGKCNKIQALSTEMVLITNNLPSGYHRDYQLLKENTIDAIESIKDILEIFDYSIAQVEVKEIDLNDEKYKYLFTVDSINDLVMQGKSFREAYQVIGGQVQEGTYKPDAGKKHSHLGSIHNLGLDKIREKLEAVIS